MMSKCLSALTFFYICDIYCSSVMTINNVEAFNAKLFSFDDFGADGM